MTYIVWTNREKLEGRMYDDLGAAVVDAADGGHLVTELTPIGDARLLLVDALAMGDTTPFAPTGVQAIYNVQRQARAAVREANTFDFDWGTTHSTVTVTHGDRTRPTV